MKALSNKFVIALFFGAIILGCGLVTLFPQNINASITNAEACLDKAEFRSYLKEHKLKLTLLGNDVDKNYYIEFAIFLSEIVQRTYEYYFALLGK